MKDKWKILTRYINLEVTEIPIYYSSTRRGKIPLLKTLYSNVCKMNCKYCPFRAQRPTDRSTWREDKLVDATLTLYREGKIKGLFLSSSIFSDPDFVVEKELEVLRKLREKGYRGYIHLRLMPGVSKYLIEEAVIYANRIGINLEAPNCLAFEEIAPDKGDFKNDLLKRLRWIVESSKKFKYRSVDTQLIYWNNLGSDIDYLELTEKIYKLGLKRVYYSPFKPIKKTPLESKKPQSYQKVYRLYQASFLIRDYGITVSELKEITDEEGNLPSLDPKELLAEKLISKPIDINTATYNELLLVPGIGPKTATRIIIEREKGKLNMYKLRKIVGKKQVKTVLKYISIPQ